MIDVEDVAGGTWVYVDQKAGPVSLMGHYHGTLRDCSVSIKAGPLFVRLGNNAGGRVLLDVSLRITDWRKPW